MGDINPVNDTLTFVFTNDATVTPGIMLGSTNVCQGNNAGQVELTGYTGYISQWQYSTNGGSGPWTNLPGTTDIHNYLDLDSNTVFQVLLDGGYCPDGVSSLAVITVDQPSDAGFMSSLTSTVCATGNSGDIVLTGYNGSIVDWESSTGTGYSSLANSNDSLAFLDLTQTTYYHAIVQNGVCPADTSAPFIVTVDVPGTAGVVVSDTSVCLGTTGAVHLAGFSGDIAYWIASDDGGNNWTVLSDTDAVHHYTATDTITYAVIVQNGICPADTSVAATIFVLPLPVALAGPDVTVFTGETLCFNAGGGLTYSWTPATDLNDPFIANPCLSPTVAGVLNYSVTVSNVYGCQDSDGLTLTVIDTLEVPPGEFGQLVICNFVTPNNDGDNDVWNIIGIERYPDNAVTIINNHGQIVFEQSAYQNTWDGESLPDGTYYYMVRIGALDKLFKGGVNHYLFAVRTLWGYNASDNQHFFSYILSFSYLCLPWSGKTRLSSKNG